MTVFGSAACHDAHDPWQREAPGSDVLAKVRDKEVAVGEVIRFPRRPRACQHQGKPPMLIDLDAIGEFARLSAQMQALKPLYRLPDDTLVEIRHRCVREVLTVRQLEGRADDMLEEREDVLRPFDHREHMRMARVIRSSLQLSRE